MYYSAVICIFSCLFLLITIICIKSTKKWFKKQFKILEKKKKELDELIYSATDMVHELNNVSDYVVTTVDQKSVELKVVMSEIDKKIAECRELFDAKPNKVVELKVKTNESKKAASKPEEINKLSTSGIDAGDIAKMLGLGKGEVELILGMKEKTSEVG